MAFGDGLKSRLEQLQKSGKDIEKTLIDIQTKAAKLAVTEAQERTPPYDGMPPRGAGTITGDMKAHWAEDSRVEPLVIKNGSEVTYISQLNNNLDYAGYVNDGHALDQHYVPGLIINPYSGLLEKVDPSLGGIVVGTQTEWVFGYFMKESAIDVYKSEVIKGLEHVVEDVFK